MANAIVQSKSCNVCGEHKLLSEYSKVHSAGNVYRVYCKKCAVKMVQDKRKDDPLWWRKFYLKKHFNMTMKDYQDMLESQDYKCLICETRFDIEVIGKRPNLDHCHSTGKIRGILCFNCNTGIGKLNDNLSTLKKAVQYLESYNNINN